MEDKIRVLCNCQKRKVEKSEMSLFDYTDSSCYDKRLLLLIFLLDLFQNRDPDNDREDFLVTRDFRLLKETVRPADDYPSHDNGIDISPEGATPRNLHELSV